MKNSLYFLKWPLILLLLGFMVRVIGAMIKILHWVNADNILIAGTIIMVVSIAWLIIKLLSLKKHNS
jgi:hypothetical protein